MIPMDSRILVLRRKRLDFFPVQSFTTDGGDFPGINKRRGRLLWGNTSALRKGEVAPCTTEYSAPRQTQYTVFVAEKQVCLFSACKGRGGEIRQPVCAFFYFGGFLTTSA